MSILVLGDDERMCGEWQDRDSLDLGGGQLALLKAVSAVAKKTVVVLVHGRPQTFGDNSVLDQVRKRPAFITPVDAILLIDASG
eukprot:COSAG02_NODE_230_length_28060_cov_5.226816_5_plen_84_part_00